ncbi:MAG: hypothetical protein WD426_08540 [Anditalea sp.]
MNRKILNNISYIFFAILFLVAGQGWASESQDIITLSCKADNDLYLTLKENKIASVRYNTPEEAISHAVEGSGVMILADGYPEKTTVMDASLFEKARHKNLKLYVEYPSYLPEVAVGMPRGTYWERAVIASDVFGPSLQKHRILAIHDCHFVAIDTDNPDIVVARVAGFDKAVYGLPEETFPVLTEIPQPQGQGGLMVSTTKLSQFITGRYAPADAFGEIWLHIFEWLKPESKSLDLNWKPVVRPSFRADEQLPEDVERKALMRGIAWYFNSRMILSPAMMARYNQPTNSAEPASSNPDLEQDWPFGHRVGLMPDLNNPVGDGTLGVLEGFDAKIFSDGTQPVRWWRRADCNGEIAGAMSVAGVALENAAYQNVGGNIGDWLFFQSMMSLGDRNNPDHPAYGLFGWNESPQYTGPGSMDGYAVYYGDDNARVMLGMMLAGATLETDRYDERLMKGLLGNLRISGVNGFQRNRIDQSPLMKIGWENLFKDNNTSFSPHFQANMWACYLWAYQHTGFDLFLERAKTAIGLTMAAYPGKWKWTNGIQQERAKMLLPLAWLVRVNDTPEHREWLRTMATDLLADQHSSGAIPEEIGELGKGGFPPPASNEAYGTSETPLIQTNEDGVSDLLYTVGFAFLGLHEAADATGDKFYSEAEDKLAKFLCRIQIQSEEHPELDGGWFRAFDFNRWEYWASNGDAGWGAWSIESGWSQSWITSVLALRQMKTSLWDITINNNIEKNFEPLQKEMIPDNRLSKQ